MVKQPWFQPPVFSPPPPPPQKKKGNKMIGLRIFKQYLNLNRDQLGGNYRQAEYDWRGCVSGVCLWDMYFVPGERKLSLLPDGHVLNCSPSPHPSIMMSCLI